MKSIHVILVKGDNTSYPIKVILYDVTVHFRHSVIETFIFIIFFFIIFFFNKMFIKETICTTILTNQTTSLNYNVKHWKDV